MSRLLSRISVICVAILCLTICVIAGTIVEYSQHSENVSADAAIVLGAAPWGDEPSPVFRERINHSLTLYNAGTVQMIIFTGGPRDAEVAREYALKNGVPDRDILWQTISRTTEQDLYYARALATSRGLKSFLIVSDPLHMKRAMSMATDLGMDAHSAPTPTTRYASWNTQVEFLLRESLSYLTYLIWRAVIRSP